MRKCPGNPDMLTLSYYVVFAPFIGLRNINLILHSATRIESKVILCPPKMAFALRQTLPYFPITNLIRIQWWKCRWLFWTVLSFWLSNSDFFAQYHRVFYLEGKELRAEKEDQGENKRKKVKWARKNKQGSEVIGSDCNGRGIYIEVISNSFWKSLMED